MTTATTVLNAARAELGTSEHPPGSNMTEFGREYGFNGVSWCDIFVSVIAARAGARDIIGHFAYTPSHARWFMGRHQWHGWREAPRRGDVLFWDWSGRHSTADPGPYENAPGIRHVSFCTGMDASVDVILSLEGNTQPGSGGNQGEGDGVYARRRSRLYLAGFGRPAYAPEKSVRPLPQPISRSGDVRRLPLLVDGCWGRATTRAVQAWCGIAQDGIAGPGTHRALQRKVGVAQDGVWGPATIRALQRTVGAHIDGSLGPMTVATLQRFLNRHL